MSKEIKIGNDVVKVSDEVYKVYYQMKRRERYLEEDIKVGSSFLDEETGRVVYRPSKEDSIERLMGLGINFADQRSLEDGVIDREIGAVLKSALNSLEKGEQELINDLFYKNMSIREVAKNWGISHVAVIKRRDKVLHKIKKFFEVSGYR